MKLWQRYDQEFQWKAKYIEQEILGFSARRCSHQRSLFQNYGVIHEPRLRQESLRLPRPRFLVVTIPGKPTRLSIQFGRHADLIPTYRNKTHTPHRNQLNILAEIDPADGWTKHPRTLGENRTPDVSFILNIIGTT